MSDVPQLPDRTPNKQATSRTNGQANEQPTAAAERESRPALPLPQQDGVLVLSKPGGMTSASCIARVKRRFGQKKIGHAGTLDPMAQGVLLVLLGQATKISGHLMDNGEKVYSGIIRLGLVTDTWDAEGRVLETRPVTGVDKDAVQAAMAALTGTYEQRVPAYSAAKHEGRPLYELARKGLDAPVKSKTVTISRGEAELVGPERIHFRVACSSGTYIRSLAHSLGSRLGCGGMLEALTREYSHPFGIGEAHALDAVLDDPEGFPERVAGIVAALPDWPKLRLGADDAARVRQGNRIAYDPAAMAMLPFAPGLRALLQDENGKALALAETALSDGRGVWALVRGLWNS